MASTLPAAPEHAVAEEVRAIMARRRISGRQAAAQLGVSPMYLSRRLAGGLPFTVTDLFRLAELLDVPVTDFLPPGVNSLASLAFVA